MKCWTRSAMLALFSLFSLSPSNSGYAHTAVGAPPLPLHHSTLVVNAALSKIGFINARQSRQLSSNALPGLGSQSTRAFNQLFRTITINGIKTGIASAPSAQLSPFNGGTVTGGTIQGDLYVLNSSGSPGQYVNFGEFTGTVGSDIPATVNTPFATVVGSGSLTPNFQNTLNFAPQTVIFPLNSHSGGGGIGGSPFLLGRGSGAQKAFANLFSGISQRSVGLGQQIGLSQRLGSLQPFGGGSVAGGLFIGTAYRNTLGSATYTATSFNNGAAPSFSPLYVFAFGNSPFNNPAGRFNLVTVPTQSSYVLFANGLRETIKNGQILYPMQNQFGGQNGSILTFGSNPANNGTLGSVLNNLNSFLFF